MNSAAIYHRPESEYAYLYDSETVHIRLRTAKDDVKRVNLLGGDPYSLAEEKWYDKAIPMIKGLSTDVYDYWTISVTAKHRRLSYAFTLLGVDGLSAFYGEHGVLPLDEKYISMANNYFRLPYFHEVDRAKSPQWVKETVWYQIFPERFANGDAGNDPEGTLKWASKAPDREDHFGGDLQGIIDHLDYIDDLGVNGLYLCPIFKANSNHKYDTIDYLEIDPDFGDKETFKNLVEACHERGIKVMLDAVFNHMGDTSPQWQDVVLNGEKSRFADWFHIHSFPVAYTPTDDFEFAADATYDTFAFTPHMPKLNTANKEVEEHLLQIGQYWIEEFDIDGWRLDVANEVDHQFWKKFHQMCVSLKPDFYILGEIWHSSQSWLHGDEFHAVMNYAYTDAILSYFIKKEIPLDKMISEMNQQLMLYRDTVNQVQFNVLDSHDTPRLLTLAKGDKDLMRQVLAFMYLQPGVPCLYYGDEIGLDGGADPDCRKCMIWDDKQQDQQLLTFMKELIALRRAYHNLLTEGQLLWTRLEDTPGYLTFLRVDPLTHLSVEGVFVTSDDSVIISLTNKTILLGQEYVISEDDTTVTIFQKGFVIMLDQQLSKEEAKR